MLTSFDSKNHENIIFCYLKQNKTWDPYSSSVDCAIQSASFLSHPHFSTPQSHLITSWMTSSEWCHWMPGHGIVPQTIGCRPAAKQDDYCPTYFHLFLQNACHVSKSSCPYNGDICGLSYLGEENSKRQMCSFYLFIFYILVVRRNHPWPSFCLLRELAQWLTKSPLPQPHRFLTRFTAVLQNIDLESN